MNQLLAYDEGRLKLPGKAKTVKAALEYQSALKAIHALKIDLAARNEATRFFGQEREHGFESILNNIEQTFDGELLYKSAS